MLHMLHLIIWTWSHKLHFHIHRLGLVVSFLGYGVTVPWGYVDFDMGQWVSYHRGVDIIQNMHGMT